MHRVMTHRRRATAVVGALALVTTAGFGLVGTAATAGASGRPVSGTDHAAKRMAVVGGSKKWANKLSSNTKGWCDGVSDAPCDGLSNDYGTIGVFKASASDAAWGGYGLGATLAGQKKFARVTGAEDGGIPTANGCSVPTGESCSGPYTLFGPRNLGADVAFGAGYTTSIKVYVDAAWGDAHPGNIVDWDTGLNGTTPHTYVEDFTIDLCSTSGGWAVNWVNGSGGCASTDGNVGNTNTPGAVLLDTSGWYTLTEQFTNQSGTVEATYQVSSDGPTGSATPTEVWNATENTGHAASTTGGPLYGWLPTEDVSGLPVAQSTLVVARP